MQKIIDAEKSDLFDVLAYVAYALPPLTREERAAKAKVIISTHFNTKQQVFLDFVLSHYVNVGVEELDQEKLTPLLRLKYHNSIADAVADLGQPEEIGKVFAASKSTYISNRLLPHDRVMSFSKVLFGSSYNLLLPLLVPPYSGLRLIIVGGRTVFKPRPLIFRIVEVKTCGSGTYDLMSFLER